MDFPDGHLPSRKIGTIFNEIISLIDEKRAETNLTAAIRVFIICYYRDAALNNVAKSGFAEEASFESRWPNREPWKRSNTAL